MDTPWFNWGSLIFSLSRVAPPRETAIGGSALWLAMFASALKRRLAPAGTAEDMAGWRRRLADASFDGLLIHQHGTILQMNNALLRMLSCREREWIGRKFSTLARPDQAASLQGELETPRPQLSVFWLRRPDQTEFPVEICSHTIEHDKRPATVTAIRDISRQMQDAAEIVRLRDHDLLTGLANRRMFTERLSEAVSRNDQHGGDSAVLIMDLDHYHQVNEEIGRAQGDDLLCQAARRIAGLLGEDGIAARISGDKFAALLTGAQSANRATVFAKQLESNFGEPFFAAGRLIRISLSIGVAMYPEHAANAEGLMKASDFAQSQAKRSGGGFAQIFSQDEANRFRAAAARDDVLRGRKERQQLSQDLRGALSAGEIGLVYQPIFQLTDMSLIGFEALARWHHRTDGLIPPAVFIPVAEEAGLIHEIGAFVLETACTEALMRARTQKMAVNLSPVQFRDTNLPSKIAAILRKTGLSPKQLEVEVTESLLIEDGRGAAQALKALRDIGVGVALDDFGTGYSSLGYLCDYPFSRLKIDKRFVHALGKDANAEAVVTAILSLARNLHLEVTAEGVETEAQLTFLKQAGCPQVQGYLLGKPSTRAAIHTPPATPPSPPRRAEALLSARAS